MLKNKQTKAGNIREGFKPSLFLYDFQPHYIFILFTSFHSFIMTKPTIRYWSTNTQKCKYISFQTYKEALKVIEMLSQIEVTAELA